jgi:hypothetical protein
MRTLYIVDGHSSAGSLKRALPHAEILIWRDALYEGPVPGGLSLAELTRVRERHWSASGELRKRDRELARFHDFDEVVLWFGPTVVCQLSLIQLLDWFAGQEKGATAISMIDHEYPGWLPPERLARHLRRKRPVTLSAYRLARRCWRGFAASDPRSLNRSLGAESDPLPELRRVLLLQAREYPDARSGLSRIEKKLLRALPKPAAASHLVASVMRAETFGDTYYFSVLRALIEARNQLVCFAQPFHGDLSGDEFRRSRIALTEFGRQVLAGKADAVVFNGIDRWIGGVHLEGYACPWRWSTAEGRVVRHS